MSERLRHLGTLGLDASASAEEIKAAYRKMARDHHPDLNPGDPEAAARFRAAAEAYRGLSEAVETGGTEDRASAGAPSVAEEVVDAASAAFEAVFGRSRDRKTRGRDHRYRLTIDLAEAARGCVREIEVQGRAPCSTCGGTGAKPGSSPMLCSTCRGQGTVKRKLGFIERNETCRACGGKGRLVDEPCLMCQGEGEQTVPRKLEVKVPPGVDTGTRLRIGEGGEPGKNGGPAGDLFVLIEVQAHSLLRREGKDLVTEVPISFAEATLGGQVEVPTLDGVVRMKIPPGSDSGRTFRLSGRGINGGEQRVVVRVEVPADLPSLAQEALRRYAEAEAQSQGLTARARYQELVETHRKKARGSG